VRAALMGAEDMKARLERLNRRLVPDLAKPLRIGISIHQGEAIVGPLGPPGSQILTAIGDTVNTAARLEGLSKTHSGAIIISRRAAEAAEMDLTHQHLHVAVLDGRMKPVEYYALAEPA
jgi:adenylate cyclase